MSLSLSLSICVCVCLCARLCVCVSVCLCARTRVSHPVHEKTQGGPTSTKKPLNIFNSAGRNVLSEAHLLATMLRVLCAGECDQLMLSSNSALKVSVLLEWEPEQLMHVHLGAKTETPTETPMEHNSSLFLVTKRTRSADALQSLHHCPLSSSSAIGACAMTTKFLDNKCCTFKIVLSWRFP